jgi:hypothetical protein
MRVKYLLSIIVLLGIVGWGPLTLFSNNYAQVPGSEKWINQEIVTIGAQATNLDPNVLKTSLTAYEKAREQGLDDKQVLTIIDYSKPSNERRLWVVDLKSQRVLFNTYVAHGRNSGSLNATSFSNEPNSLKSSIGVFVTSEPYTGHDGYSLRIQGLEHGINDNVLRRQVVFHGAPYVSEAVAKSKGMMGRSWGCMAVSLNTIRPLINTIKEDTLVVAYYPDNHWLKKSTFLT